MREILKIHIVAGIAIFLIVILTLLIKIPHYITIPASLIILFYIFIKKISDFFKPLKNLEEVIHQIVIGNMNARIEVPKSGISLLLNITRNFNQILDAFTSLLNVSQLLGKEHNLDKLLNLVIAETTKNLDAERTTLFLYNKETGELWSYIAQNLEIKEIRMPVGKGIAGYVAKTRRLLNIRDAYNDERFDREYDQFTGFRTRNLLCTPLINSKNEIIGVIQVLNKIGDELFTEYDETLLSAISNEASIAIENTGLYDAQEKLLRSTMFALSSTIDARDPVTKGHSDRVSKYSVSIGQYMNLSPLELKSLEYAGLLHDVGKISISDDILSKPGMYSSEEMTQMRKHAASTKEILEKIYFPEDQKIIPMIAASHHEKLDGSGYPNGLTNKDIPFLARILAVADIYDALVSYDRPYKPAVTIEDALAVLVMESKSGKVDTEVVNIFIQNKLYNLEKREYIRIDTELAIEFRLINPDEWRNIMPLVAKTKNISAKGLLFKTELPIPLNSYLEIRLHLTDFTVDVLAKVLRKFQFDNNYEYGISFINLSEKAKDQLHAHLTTIS